jgi:catechol-2,3-dioxygenase
MLEWYESVFDAKVQFENPVIAFLTYDDEHHRFAFVDLGVVRSDIPETDRKGLIGVDHVAYTYESVPALLENYAELKEAGIEPYWCVHHGVTISMYYADPDGNQMEFQVDCFPSREETKAYMDSHFEANPVGVEYDPEEWLGRLRAGEPAEAFIPRHAEEPISPIRGSMTA